VFRVTRETDICHALSSERDTRARERRTRRCTYGIHKRRYVRTYTSSLSMAHCLSHQFAGFMRGLNEVIRRAINVLIAVKYNNPFFSLCLIGIFATDYVRAVINVAVSKY